MFPAAQSTLRRAPVSCASSVSLSLFLSGLCSLFAHSACASFWNMNGSTRASDMLRLADFEGVWCAITGNKEGGNSNTESAVNKPRCVCLDNFFHGTAVQVARCVFKGRKNLLESGVLSRIDDVKCPGIESVVCRGHRCNRIRA